MNDLTGQRFGRLVVVKRNQEPRRNRVVYWDCICDCGNQKTVRGTALTGGITQSCGCLAKEYQEAGTTKKAITGQRFGRLVVMGEAQARSSCGEIKYRCRCDCGKETTVTGTSLRNGTSQSCGCFLSDATKERTTTHGESHTRLYKIWDGMKQRCSNPNRQEWERYGGRGIRVCAEWAHDFAAFRDWALANGYRDDLEVDRTDNDGPYSPENCRWVTHYENMMNRG